MNESKEMWMRKLEELLCDEDKIVTASFLSSDLKIPLEESNNILVSYLKNTEKSGHLSKMYILMGILKDENGLGVYLVKEDELEEKRKLFNSVMSEQIYSLQKCKNMNVTGLSYINGNEIFEESDKFGLIVGYNCYKVEDQATSNNMAPTTTKEEKSNVLSKDNGVSGTLVKDKVQQKKFSSNIKNLFSTMPVKETKTEMKNTETVAVEKENKNANIASEGNRTDKIGNHETDSDLNKSKSSNKPQKIKEKKKRIRTDDNEEHVKKRKRIIQQSDSDSDDIFGSQEEDLNDVHMPDEEKEPVFTLNEDKSERKSKKLKVISKQYEDGEFIVTKKERVMVSDSDEDEQGAVVKGKTDETGKPSKAKESPPKVAQKNNKKNVKKETASKQPTLMNFFTKK